MLNIQGWTQDSCQKQVLLLSDGTSISLAMNYIPNQYGWFIQEITYQTLTVKNLRMVVSPNILQQFKNQIPFGLACFTTDGMESTQQQDLNSNYAILYILTPDEVEQYTEILSAQA